jgi:hypothetical protein
MLTIYTRTDALKSLSLLQGCLALEVLALKDSHGLINLEATENDTFVEIVDVRVGKAQNCAPFPIKQIERLGSSVRSITDFPD